MSGAATSQGAAATEQRDGYRWTEVPLTGLKAVRQCGGAAGTCPAPPAVPASPGATVATGEADGSAERRVVLPKSAAGGEEKRG